jgi:hypothetical protein
MDFVFEHYTKNGRYKFKRKSQDLCEMWAKVTEVKVRHGLQRLYNNNNNNYTKQSKNYVSSSAKLLNNT